MTPLEMLMFIRTYQINEEIWQYRSENSFCNGVCCVYDQFKYENKLKVNKLTDFEIESLETDSSLLRVKRSSHSYHILPHFQKV